MWQSCWHVGKGFWSSPGSGYNGGEGGGGGVEGHSSVLVVD